MIKERFGARALVEGVNFGYGRNRAGNVDRLAEQCRAADISLVVVPPVRVDGGEVSSSRIRAALLAGDVAAATQMLGWLYRLAARSASASGVDGRWAFRPPTSAVWKH